MDRPCGSSWHKRKCPEDLAHKNGRRAGCGHREVPQVGSAVAGDRRRSKGAGGDEGDYPCRGGEGEGPAGAGNPGQQHRRGHQDRERRKGRKTHYKLSQIAFTRRRLQVPAIVGALGGPFAMSRIRAIRYREPPASAVPTWAGRSSAFSFLESRVRSLRIAFV